MKPTTPLLSILIPCLQERQWYSVVEQLATQRDILTTTDPDLVGRIEILCELDNRDKPSGWKRQQLLNRSRGRYICYVDDDDYVEPDYLLQIIKGCESGADVINFNMRFYNYSPDPPIDPMSVEDTKPRERMEIWQLRLNVKDNRKDGVMSCNHLCVWRSTIAKRVGWTPQLGCGDDQLWYKPINQLGIALTEHTIDKVLYNYSYHSSKTLNQNIDAIEKARKYFGRGIAVYRDNYTEQILIQLGYHPINREQIWKPGDPPIMRKVSLRRHPMRLYAPNGEVVYVNSISRMKRLTRLMTIKLRV